MKVKQQFSVQKAADYAIIINSLQIAAVLALAVYILIDGVNAALHGLLGDVILLTLAGIVTWGAVVDIREAIAARHMNEKLGGLNETVDQMTDLNHALRAQRHDFLNHLQVVYSLMEMQEYDEAGKYIEHVYGDIQAVSRTLKTQCAPVNALLRVKMAECEQAGIHVTLDITAQWSDLPIPAWEMCRVLSNIIDNAIDALKDTEDKQLCISLTEDLHAYSFDVSNNGPMVPLTQRSRIFEAGFSGKGKGRGMGLYIARETLRNAGGDLTLSSDATRTAFHGVVLRMPQGH